MTDQIPYVDQVSYYLVKNCELYRVADKQTNRQTDERALGERRHAKIPQKEIGKHSSTDK